MPKKTTAFGALLAALFTVAQAQQPRLYITTETSAPSSMREGGRVTGIATDKVREIMARAGIAYSIELLPWKRAYTAALRRPDACVYSTTRTPEREHQFSWVGPLDEAEWVLMGRTGRSFALHGLEDARGYRIGTYNGDAREQYLRAHGFAADSAQDDLINPRKLLLDRIDLWAASLRHGSTVLERNGWGGKFAPVLVFKQIEVYLACNRGVPDSLVQRMNEVAEEMRLDGSARRIERAYENWSPRRPR